MESMGQLYCLGYRVDIPHLNATGVDAQEGAIVLPDLPQYPFDHSKTY